MHYFLQSVPGYLRPCSLRYISVICTQTQRVCEEECSNLFEDAALARAREAQCLRTGGHLGGALYLAGYVVECRLKVLLGKMGRKYPKAGRAGHDLVALWQAAGLRYSDLSGFRRAFIDYWSTDLRYSASISSEHSAEDLLDGARDLAGYVTKRIANTRGIKRTGVKYGN